MRKRADRTCRVARWRAGKRCRRGQYNRGNDCYISEADRESSAPWRGGAVHKTNIPSTDKTIHVSALSRRADEVRTTFCFKLKCAYKRHKIIPRRIGFFPSALTRWGRERRDAEERPTCISAMPPPPPFWGHRDASRLRGSRVGDEKARQQQRKAILLATL